MLGRAIHAGVCALSATFFVPSPALADTPPVVSFEVASAFPSNTPILGDATRRLSDTIGQISAGKIAIKFKEPGEWVSLRATLQDVGAGSAEAAWAGSAWLASVDSAFGLFYAIPFGPAAQEYLAWLYYGGGLEISRDMFHANGIHNVPCVMLPPSGAGWFNRPIANIEDLKGMRLRSFSLGERVLQTLGAKTYQIPAGDIAKAMRNGELDGVELLLPQIDLQMDLWSSASYYYFPSWHKQSALIHLYVNKARWDSLPPVDRSLIEIACKHTMVETLIHSEAVEWRAMQAIREKGVQIRKFSPEVLLALEKAWKEFAAEESKRNPNFKRAFESLTTFRLGYGTWSYLSALQ